MHLSRRHFLKDSLGAATLLSFGPGVPGFLSRAAAVGAANRSGPGSVLVVIQLSGGNDGLNTVVPYEDDAYQRSRPTLRLPATRVHKLGSGLGLHPDMPAFARLYQEGQLSIVQGVGYPESKRDHEEALRDWATARPTEPAVQTGWAGRALDQAFVSSQSDVPGLFLGEIAPPFSLRAEQALVPAIRSLDQWLLAAPGRGHGSAGDRLQAVLAQAAAAPGLDRDDPLLAWIRETTRQACATSKRLSAGLESRDAKAAVYPSFPLAQTLKTVARLMRAELGIRIFFAELGGGGIGGFDTHAGQATNHGALLHELSESVAAFLQDLRQDKLLSSVLVMTFSEFGRTLSENGRRGTDHGAAAPLFFAGGQLKGGLVGAHPGLTDLEQDAPKHHTDFRRLYATALGSWLGFDTRAILGEPYAPLDGVLQKGS